MTQTTASMSFTIAAHRAVQEWAAPSPGGLRVEIAMDMEVSDEVFCLYRRGAAEPAFYLTPSDAGRVDVCVMPEGNGLVADGIVEALTWVEAAARALDAEG